MSNQELFSGDVLAFFEPELLEDCGISIPQDYLEGLTIRQGISLMELAETETEVRNG